MAAYSLKSIVAVSLVLWMSYGSAVGASGPAQKPGLDARVIDGPRIVILYDPGEPGIPLTGDLAERELVRRFKEKGFPIVDPAIARRLRREAGPLLRFESPDNVAARLSLGHNADIVLIYRLVPIHTGTDGAGERARSTMSVRAMLTTTARLLGTSTESASGIGATRELAVADATQKASAAVADIFSGRIAVWWTSLVDEGLPYTIVLESNPKKRLEPRFTRRLAGLPGLVSLNLRACGGDFCEYQLLYRGTLAKLRTAVIRALKGEPGFGHVVTRSNRADSLVFSVE